MRQRDAMPSGRGIVVDDIGTVNEIAVCPSTLRGVPLPLPG